MAEARFYQVGGNLPADVDAVLPGLLEKIVGGGQRVLVVAADAAVSRLDERLWPTGSGFLPHGRVGEGDEARQPILLCNVGQAAAHAAGRLTVVVAGAEEVIDKHAEMPLESLVYLFHGAMAETAAKRQAGLAQNGWQVSFFQQTPQGWRKQST